MLGKAVMEPFSLAKVWMNSTSELWQSYLWHSKGVRSCSLSRSMFRIVCALNQGTALAFNLHPEDEMSCSVLYNAAASGVSSPIEQLSHSAVLAPQKMCSVF